MQAFARLLRDTRMTEADLFSDPLGLGQLLTYHFLPEVMATKRMKAGMHLHMLDGSGVYLQRCVSRVWGWCGAWSRAMGQCLGGRVGGARGGAVRVVAWL